MAKLVRLSSMLDREPELSGSRPHPFLFLDGLIADLIPWCSAGGHGTVSGIPNFAPRAVMKLWRFCSNPRPTPDETKEAKRIQAILSNADAAAVPGGIRAMSQFFPTCLSCRVRSSIFSGWLTNVRRVCVESTARIWDRTSEATITARGEGG